MIRLRLRRSRCNDLPGYRVSSLFSAMAGAPGLPALDAFMAATSERDTHEEGKGSSADGGQFIDELVGGGDDFFYDQQMMATLWGGCGHRRGCGPSAGTRSKTVLRKAQAHAASALSAQISL